MSRSPAFDIYAEVLVDGKWASYNSVVVNFKHRTLHNLLTEVDCERISDLEVELAAKLEHKEHEDREGDSSIWCLTLDLIKEIGKELDKITDTDVLDCCDPLFAEIAGTRYMDLDAEQMEELGISDVRWLFWFGS